jgi:hypothetical protein
MLDGCGGSTAEYTFAYMLMIKWRSLEKRRVIPPPEEENHTAVKYPSSPSERCHMPLGLQPVNCGFAQTKNGCDNQGYNPDCHSRIPVTYAAPRLIFPRRCG